MSTKSVVFSQFRKMLILLEEPLKAAGFEVVRLDERMKSTRKRNRLVEEFENMNSANSHIVLLADHKASNACINLTFATRAYLLEPWCNPIIEDQAINRLHRIGRQQEIKITRIITKNSIEERIMQLHEWKKNLRSGGHAENMDKRQIHREEFRILMAL
ncbi:putative SWI/SNF-related matrix-associated actin-dependent regulator of chromatin subfamily A member 3-like 1 [Papaver somniferum]|uniref:putative SWI/SNF-related matrix-associated actin-dependent regulator of chromatin subfamily A member 3-like 1 n=1 Tax=Papaver somniferum TaxID=3469 RepID=UPI000E702407|nr:putative SWI/SNF-related matrix-associated actin-dependent regulator of chromatin subfamily A member 3-like 1 [Papaver somniferum]